MLYSWNKSKIQNFHWYSVNKYNVGLSVLTDMNSNHVFAVKLAIIRSIRDIFVSSYIEYNARNYPVVMYVKDHVIICQVGTTAIKPAVATAQERK